MNVHLYWLLEGECIMRFIGGRPISQDHLRNEELLRTWSEVS